MVGSPGEPRTCFIGQQHQLYRVIQYPRNLHTETLHNFYLFKFSLWLVTELTVSERKVIVWKFYYQKSVSIYLSIYCHVFYNLGICRYRTYPKCSLMRPPSLSPCIWMLSWGGHLHTAAMENIVISHVISNVTLVIANPIIVIGCHYSISTDWGSSNVSTYTSYSDPQTWLGRNNIIIHNITHYTWTLHNTNQPSPTTRFLSY